MGQHYAATVGLKLTFITEGANVTFIENKAWAYGGAIFVDIYPVLCRSGFS